MITISNSLFPYFEKAGTSRHIKSGELVYMQGENSHNIYLIAKGRVRMFYISDDGKEITYQILGAGQLIGESAFLKHISRPTTISAVNDVILISCQVEQLRPYMQKSEELSKAIFALLTDNYYCLCSQVRRLTIFNRFQKVASYLLEQTVEDNQEVGIVDSTLPYTHEELSVCLNLNRVTVTKILNQFQEQGMVKLKRKKIQVLNREKLLKIVNREIQMEK